MHTISYNTQDGRRHGLLLDYEGTKFVKVLLVDNPLVVRKIPRSELRYIKNLDDYPVAKTIKVLCRCARNFHGGLRGCTEQVREVLR